ncbi:MAG: hypothetical protein HY519_00800 [Candidatus Aenigmarchaeota archaeon]|nr:hypothetical protein [Candidatus Aenigmarchaeota archaeon]
MRILALGAKESEKDSILDFLASRHGRQLGFAVVKLDPFQEAGELPAGHVVVSTSFAVADSAGFLYTRSPVDIKKAKISCALLFETQPAVGTIELVQAANRNAVLRFPGIAAKAIAIRNGRIKDAMEETLEAIKTFLSP